MDGRPNVRAGGGCSLRRVTDGEALLEHAVARRVEIVERDERAADGKGLAGRAVEELEAQLDDVDAVYIAATRNAEADRAKGAVLTRAKAVVEIVRRPAELVQRFIRDPEVDGRPTRHVAHVAYQHDRRLAKVGPEAAKVGDGEDTVLHVKGEDSIG